MRPVSLQLLILCLLISPVPTVHAQQRGNAAAKPPELLRNVPSALQAHSTALGDRVLVEGKEKTVLDGKFSDENGKESAVRLTLQFPDLVRLEGPTKDGPPPLTFDGKTRLPRATHIEEALLETLTSDTAEGMMASIQEGAAVELVARRVMPEASRHRNEMLPVCDIFEVSGPVRSSATTVERLKRYFFDSETGLLVSTQYFDEAFSPPMGVETRFSDWRRFDGSAYPGRIERLENGRTVFSFDVKAITASPKQDPASFR